MAAKSGSVSDNGVCVVPKSFNNVCSAETDLSIRLPPSFEPGVVAARAFPASNVPTNRNNTTAKRNQHRETFARRAPDWPEKFPMRLGGTYVFLYMGETPR